MSDLTNFAENRINDAVWRGQALGAPATWHYGLATAVADADAGTVTEVVGGSYARAPLAATLANFAGTQGAGTTVASTGTSGQTSNNAVITFPTPTANWGQATHLVAYDAPTGGNAWVVRALQQPKNINNGDPAPTFPAAAFTFTLA
jgi:hypothetical protein